MGDAEILNSIMVPVTGEVAIPTDIGQPISSVPTVDSKQDVLPPNAASQPTVLAENSNEQTNQNLVDATSVGGLWKSGSNSIVADFQFNHLAPATNFVNRILTECERCSCEALSLGVNTPGKDDGDGDTDWVVHLELGPIESQVTGKSLRVAQLASYLHTKFTSISPSALPCYYEDYSDNLNNSESGQQQLEEPAEEEVVQSWMAAFQNMGNISLSEEGKVIKVPFCRIGNWKHPIYGDLTFTQQDFDDIINNFDGQILGYEPPLFLGHPIDTSTQQGHPAEGFLHSLVQEDDVLYGLFEMVNEETYSSVSSGRYRYSSGEFVRNHTSKESGKSVGTVLVGVALTNRPFLTGLPRVSTLADSAGDNTVASLICLSTMSTQQTEISKETPVAEAPAPATPAPAAQAVTPAQPAQVLAESATGFEEFKKLMLADFAGLKEMYSTQMQTANQKLAEYEVKLTAQEAELRLLRDEADAAKQKLRNTEVEHKLAELNKLVLPEEVREKYSELIKSGALGQQESVVMDTLRAMSNSRVQDATTQRGDATQALSDPNENPFTSIIERNERIAKKKEEDFLSSLGA